MKGNILKKHRKKLIILCIILIIGIIVATFLFRKPKSKFSTSENSMTVTETLSKRTLTNSISVTGTLASSDSKSISVDLNNIEISEMNVAVGDTVKQGDIICTFDSSDIEEALAKAKQNLSAASIKSSINLETAERNLENAELTRDIEASRQDSKVSSAYNDYLEAVNSEDDAENTYNSSVTAYNNAKTAMDNAAGKVNSTKQARNNALNSFNDALSSYQGSISGNSDISSVLSGITIDSDFTALISSASSTELIQILTKLQSLQAAYLEKNTAYTKAQSAYATAQKNYQSASDTMNAAKTALNKAQEDMEAKLDSYTTTKQNADDSSRNNNNSVISQQNNLTSAQLDASTATDSQEETVENYETQLENCTLIAPMDGVITSLSFDSGDTYNGGELCVIQNTDSFIVSATVDQYDISDIAKDMKAIIKTDTTEDLEMSGTVTFVSPTPQNSDNLGSSQTLYPIKISIEDFNERLRIGMTAKVSIILESAEDVFAVPYDCIQTDRDGSSYIQVSDLSNSSGTLKNITVTTGIETDYYVEISGSDLSEGMKVIVPGQIATTDSLDMNDLMPGFSTEFEQNEFTMPDGGGMGGGRKNGSLGGMNNAGGSSPRQ